MSHQQAAQEGHGDEGGGFSVIWLLIGIIMVLALYTTIHGLKALTGSYIYAVPFGLVAQSILLIASLNLGRDIAHMASGTTSRVKVNGSARGLRTLFLVAVYFLFFVICWIFAFSTYYNIFLARGDDVQTTASQAVQLGDQVLPELRTRVARRMNAAASELREREPVKSFVTQVGEFQQAATRPEVAATIARAAFEASQRAYDLRRQQREQWTQERATLQQRQETLRNEIASRTRDLENRKAEREGLPIRLRDLRRAQREELTGVLEPLPPAEAAPSPEGAASPPATAPTNPPPPTSAAGSQPGTNPQPGEAAIAATRPGAPRAPARPQVTVQPGQLRPDGLAASLVRSPDCQRQRDKGPGGCATALAEAIKQAEDRSTVLLREIPNVESKLEELHAERDALPERLGALAKRLADNPAMAPPSQNFTGTQASGPDLSPLTNARTAFGQTLSIATFTVVADACKPIEVAIRGINQMPSALSGFDCRPESVASALRGHRNLVEAEEKFRARCDVAPAGERTTAAVDTLRDDFSRNTELRNDDSVRRERLGKAMDEVRREVIDPCLALAGALGVPTEDLNRTARNFEDQASPRQTEFSLAINAALQVVRAGATPPAYFGALFAFAQEMAILLLSILRDLNRGARSEAANNFVQHAPAPNINWAVRPDDPPLVAAVKTLIAMLHHRPDGSAILRANFAEDEPSDIRANMQQIVRQLMRAGTAKPAMIGGTIRISHQGIAMLEDMIKAHYHTQAPSPASSSTPSPNGPGSGPGSASPLAVATAVPLSEPTVWTGGDTATKADPQAATQYDGDPQRLSTVQKQTAPAKPASRREVGIRSRGRLDDENDQY